MGHPLLNRGTGSVVNALEKLMIEENITIIKKAEVTRNYFRR